MFQNITGNLHALSDFSNVINTGRNRIISAETIWSDMRRT